MFREIRKSERITDQDEKRERRVDITKRIKPATDITAEQARMFIQAEFDRVAAEAALEASQGK